MNRSGFNLIELIAAMGVLAISIPAIVSLFAVAFGQEAHTANHTRALFLARSLMSEIAQRRFREDAGAPGNGADSGEVTTFDRRAFDDIDDYAQFQIWGPLKPPRDESGNALATFSDLTQNVEVTNIAAPLPGPAPRINYTAVPAGTTDFKLVKVSISWDQGKRHVDLHRIIALP